MGDLTHTRWLALFKDSATIHGPFDSAESARQVAETWGGLKALKRITITEGEFA